MGFEWRDGAVWRDPSSIGGLCLLSLSVFPQSMWQWFGLTEEVFDMGTRQKLNRELSNAVMANTNSALSLRPLEDICGNRQAELLGPRLEMFGSNHAAHSVQWWVRTLGEIVEQPDSQIVANLEPRSCIARVWSQEVDQFVCRFFELKYRKANRALSERDHRILEFGDHKWFPVWSSRVWADCWATLFSALNQVSCETALRCLQAELSVSEWSDLAVAVKLRRKESVKLRRKELHLNDFDLNAERLMAFPCKLARSYPESS